MHPPVYDLVDQPLVKADIASEPEVNISWIECNTLRKHVIDGVDCALTVILKLFIIRLLPIIGSNLIFG